jgi:HprK-related kinase A
MSRRQRVYLQTGPFRVQLDTDCAALVDLLNDFYPHLGMAGAEGICSFHVGLLRPRGLRGSIRPQIRFLVDEGSPFEPYPLDHAFPLWEWGLNWCIAMRAHQYLMLHSAAVERGGLGLILPALPGSGKSTLCAALALRHWRLLSDEFGLFDLAERLLMPLPRAVPLKNESIEVIRAFSPDAHLGPLFAKTRKGDVAHLRPPGDSLVRQREPVPPRWIVFPRFQSGQPVELRALPKSQAFVRLAQNSFNYAFLRAEGFRALSEIVERCDCYSLVFGSLDDALAAIDATCLG